jgi:hypothetical protein
MPHALRILSGTVHMPRSVTPGSFIIDFYPFSLGACDPGTELKNQKEIGARGRFINAPATIVTRVSSPSATSAARLHSSTSTTRSPASR